MIACTMQDKLAGKEEEFDSCHGAAYSVTLYNHLLWSCNASNHFRFVQFAA